jgi:hypothetical protein
MAAPQLSTRTTENIYVPLFSLDIREGGAAISSGFLDRSTLMAIGRTIEAIRLYELISALDGELGMAATAGQHELARPTTAAFAAWVRHDYLLAERLCREILERFPDDTVAALYIRHDQGGVGGRAPGGRKVAL